MNCKSINQKILEDFRDLIHYSVFFINRSKYLKQSTWRNVTKVPWSVKLRVNLKKSLGML